MYQLAPVRHWTRHVGTQFFIELHNHVIFILEVSEDLTFMGIKSTIRIACDLFSTPCSMINISFALNVSLGGVSWYTYLRYQYNNKK